MSAAECDRFLLWTLGKTSDFLWHLALDVIGLFAGFYAFHILSLLHSNKRRSVIGYLSQEYLY